MVGASSPGATGRLSAWFANGLYTPEQSRVLRYRLIDRVSTLFELEFTIALADELPMDLESMEEMLQSPCAFVLGDSGGAGEPLYGVLRQWELLEAADGKESLYRGVIVPTLWYATQTHRSRVFQDLSVPEVVEQVLGEAGLELGEQFELALTATYAPSEYIVQYEESDFAFLARLLEREGISFAFEHADGTDKVVFLDDPSSYRDGTPEAVPFELAASADSHSESIFRVRRRLSVGPQKVVVRDSNYRTPLVPLQADAEVHADGLGLVALYADHFKDDGEAARVARIRAEELAVDRHTLSADAYVRSLRAGQTFEVTGHSIADLAARYLVVEIERHGALGEPETHTLQLLPAELPFRPPRVTRCPRIFGLMHARIDGEAAGPPAPLDEEGRYRVLLPMDFAGEIGGRASRWIRRSQVYAGPGYGMHFPLHVGTEVLVAHLDGDPDRPVIVGAVPNPATTSPVTGDNATQSIVRSKANIVQEFEDDA